MSRFLMLIKLFKCTFPNCKVTSKTKRNLKLKKKRKAQKNSPQCKTTFSQKYNRDRHVKNVHQEDNQVYEGKNDASIISPYDGEMMEAPEEAMEKTSQESATFQISSLANEEILNASFTSEAGKISDVSM